MQRTLPLLCLTAWGTSFLIQPVAAQDDRAFSYSGEFEIGIEATTDADDPDAEISDLFYSAEIEIDFPIGMHTSFFSELSFESVIDPEENRAFEDLGLYIGELGFAYDLGDVTLRLGKFAPAFGSAWDTAPGYFGADLADEYELEEMIGLSVEIERGDGLLTLSAFYPDDSRLSDSWGTRRGRNTPQDGGVGNTGRLDNVALQYDHELDATTLHLGLRHLSRGEEDSNENAVAVGLTHAFTEDMYVIAEVAHFNGWEGSSGSAVISTLGASLERGPITYSAAASFLDVSDGDTDHLISLGLDYALKNGMVLSAGYARTREEGEDADNFAISLIVPFD